MPAGLLVTTPLPDAGLLTERALGFNVKLAITVFGPSIVTVQDPVPVQAPSHPIKVESPSAAAVRVTMLSVAKGAEQVVPQLIPGEALITLPWPFPPFWIVTAGASGFSWKLLVAM